MGYRQLGIVSGLVVSGIVLIGSDRALAQSSNIAPDNTLGAESSRVVPRDAAGLPVDRIDGGAIRGANLFHSFEEFSVSQGRGAYFTNPNGIQNILSRVTGKNPSDIQGTLGVLGNANLFLINPNGIIFSKEASLDVGGSFVATTANAIELGNTGMFSASAPQASNLLSVAPSALLFNAISNQKIINRSTATKPVLEFFLNGAADRRSYGLEVLAGKSLLLVGGDVIFENGSLKAAGGRVELGSVIGEGIVKLNPIDKGWALDYADARNFGSIQLSRFSLVDVSGEGSGDVQIQANRFLLLDALTTINASTLGAQDGGNIIIRANDEVILDNSGILANVDVAATGTGGDLFIDTKRLVVSDGAQIQAGTFGRGKGGGLTVNASESVDIFNPNGNNKTTRLFTATSGRGDAGDLTIRTGRLSIRDGAFVATEALPGSRGKGGNLTVNASNSVEVAGTTDNSLFSSSLSTRTRGAGRAGDLQVTTNRLTIRDGGTVSAETFSEGEAGNLTVNASELVEILGGAPNDRFSSAIQADTRGAGDAGDIRIATKRLVMKDGGFVGSIARAGSTGNAGSLIIIASDSVNLIGRTPNRNFPSGISASVLENASGDGGNVNIETQRLSIRDRAGVFVSNLGNGQAGTLQINARDSVELFGTPSSALNVASGLDAQGEGGNLTIETGRLSVRDGSLVLLTTLGKANAGTLKIKATDSVEISGKSLVTQLPSQLNASSGIPPSQLDTPDIPLLPNFTGQGGNIDIQTGSLVLKDGAQINASASGPGNAGSINLNVDRRLTATDGDISTVALQSSGGALSIKAGDIRLSGNSNITSFVFSGTSGGGDINLSADSIIAFDDSDILAFALDGAGGNISLNTPAFFSSPPFRSAPAGTNPLILDGNQRVDINATGAVAGIVTIPDVSFIQNSLTELPQNPIDTNALIANSCIARSASNGTFTVTGAGGLPNRPGDAANSPYPTGDVRSVEGDTSNDSTHRPWKIGDPIVEPQAAYRLADGQMVLSRQCER